MASKASALVSETPRSSAPLTIASASGCSEPRSRLAARRSNSSLGSCPAIVYRDQFWLAHGQRAGLVHDQDVDGGAQRPAFLISTPAARRGGGGTMIDIECSQPSAHGGRR